MITMRRRNLFIPLLMLVRFSTTSKSNLFGESAAVYDGRQEVQRLFDEIQSQTIRIESEQRDLKEETKRNNTAASNLTVGNDDDSYTDDDNINSISKDLFKLLFRDPQKFANVIKGSSSMMMMKNRQGKGMTMKNKNKKSTKSPAKTNRPTVSISPSPSLSLSPSPSSTSFDNTPSPTKCNPISSGMMSGMGKGGMGSKGKGRKGTSKGKKDCSETPDQSPAPTPQPKKENKKCKKGKSKKGDKTCTDVPTSVNTTAPTIFETGVPTLSPFPTISPSPTIKPTRAPTRAVPTRQPSSGPFCTASSGVCVTTEDQLQTAIDNATVGDTISICDRTIVDVTQIITSGPAQSDLTICCNTGCILASTGNDSILFLEGPSPTLYGISFRNGRTDEFNGGNVAIETSGDIKILKCDFRNGFSNETGGNLFIEAQNGGTVTIEDSTFENGAASRAGGGVSIFDASLVTVKRSTFRNNTAIGTGEGGGLYCNKNPNITAFTLDVVIDGSTFDQNDARAGAGFLLFELGTNASVTITNNDFNDNLANVAAVGGILVSLEETTLVIDGNDGANNSGGICDDFLTFRTANDGVCIPVDETFVSTP